ncbi:MAG: fumarylacetoacetate hydrolase family protein, partial [Anaerolineae bacterium]|nr:fumarylacetoacetate hydrolase family protein [Anaerolineae bacterium]
LNPAMQVVGFTIGNDMSSRDIEGANPLYLPQAKVYDKSCAIGPRIWLNPTSEWPEVDISIRIERDGQVAFSDRTDTSQIKRKIVELASYLGRSHTLADGAILLTGTGVVPSAEFTLKAGDVVKITIDPIGTLTNTVCVV